MWRLVWFSIQIGRTVCDEGDDYPHRRSLHNLARCLTQHVNVLVRLSGKLGLGPQCLKHSSPIASTTHMVNRYPM